MSSITINNCLLTISPAHMALEDQGKPSYVAPGDVITQDLQYMR